MARWSGNPGQIERYPKRITPSHDRLDWQMRTGRTMVRSPWMCHFLIKLLERYSDVDQILERDPWSGLPPKCIKVDAYRCRSHGEEEARNLAGNERI